MSNTKDFAVDTKKELPRRNDEAQRKGDVDPGQDVSLSGGPERPTPSPDHGGSGDGVGTGGVTNILEIVPGPKKPGEIRACCRTG
ncbi:hypothetical protein BTHE68_71340 (plasmid) [Burkholderia sp. THE68]|nr:hypothetical protein BTHE68_71340 [Burkholderia sp. THE68]